MLIRLFSKLEKEPGLKHVYEEIELPFLLSVLARIKEWRPTIGFAPKQSVELEEKKKI